MADQLGLQPIGRQGGVDGITVAPEGSESEFLAGLVPILGAIGGAAPGISAIGNIAGGIFGGISDVVNKGAQRRQAGRQAANLDPIIQELLDFDTMGLELGATRQLTQGSRALSAQLAQAGLAGSGVEINRQTELTSNVLSQLARDIDASQRARLGAAGQLIQGTPGFGFFDRQTGRTRGK